MRGTGLLAVPSESNDLRERPSNRSTGEKGAEANGEPAVSTLRFLRRLVLVYREMGTISISVGFPPRRD